MVNVLIIESEKGWGQKVDEKRQFDTLEEAEEWIKNYNASNDELVTPDWYMFAILESDYSR